MSRTGQNSKSIKKLDVLQSKSQSIGFTKLVFAHKATLGDEGIDLASLVVPPEMAALGFVNPSPSRLLEARIFAFKDNLALTSSAKNSLVQNLSFTVNSNNFIKFQGFTAEDGEIFVGVIDANPSSGIQVVDVKQQAVDGDLADGDTDFPIGFSTKTGSQDILVFRDGLEQKRNSNNSDTVLDGNYYVVESSPGSGYGSVIRFNTAASGSDDYIKVTAIGGVIESPTNSTWDELEKVQGQIDAMIPDLAIASGNPESTYQSAPNNVDLRQFGAKLNELINNFNALLVKLDADTGVNDTDYESTLEVT